MVAFVNTSLNDPGCTGQTGLVALTRGAAGVAAGVATTAGVVRVAAACVTRAADAGAAADVTEDGVVIAADGDAGAGVVTGLAGAEEFTELAVVTDGATGFAVDIACVTAGE